MYIRKTKTKTADHGDDSYTYQFVESVHEGTQVKQRTLLNLGNDFAFEPATLELMLEGRQGKNPLTGEKPVLIMDADIASAANIAWLSERNYLYLAISRERSRQVPRDQDHAVLVRETEQSQVTVYRTIDAETKETRLYCHSDQKDK